MSQSLGLLDSTFERQMVSDYSITENFVDALLPVSNMKKPYEGVPSSTTTL